MEWKSGVFSDESRFCLGASDGHVLVRRRPGERRLRNCQRPSHTRPAPGVMVRGAISYDSKNSLMVITNTLTANLYVNLVIHPIVLPFMNCIQRGIFEQNYARPHTAVITQCALQSVTCSIDLRDHHIFLQLNPYRI
ncbi:HTH_Tnp_Tc3_2 domain-containing protein [Trichonephila clavipes]|uniref:HTH_Tnp_Tc3_2 domain-containing protein n=1 Tax=Trichonephila clavipes TaxID=2585209 RepID=A0A8X6VPI8_TRICX|nr:HTH_Tnp_Tc3_2 domain-containing protein [Trichonephila clavipes]